MARGSYTPSETDLYVNTVNECRTRLRDLYSPTVTAPDNAIIWHYTSFEGLQGIAKTRRLWATNVAYMNDSQELQYGKSICKIVLDTDTNLTELCDAAGFKLADFLINVETYVACFSGLANSLSQWARYSANGNGVAICFRLKDIMRIFNNEHTWITVKYDVASQREYIKNVVGTCLTFLSSHGVQNPNLFLACFARVLHSFIPALKHPGFEEEQEVRLVIIPDARNCLSDFVKFRSSNNMLIHYLESPVEIDSAIHGIIVGPNPHRELNARSVRKLLKTLGYLNEIEVAYRRYLFDKPEARAAR